jgi:Cu/Ag efflux protein CusF
MKRFVAPLVAAFALTAASYASAADITATIKSMDMTTHSVTLDNGIAYNFDSKFDLSKFKVGEKVKLSYTEQNGQYMASGLVAAS